MNKGRHFRNVLDGLPADQRRSELRDLLRSLVPVVTDGEFPGVPPEDTPFRRLGIHTGRADRLCVLLADRTGITIRPEALRDHPSPDALAAYLLTLTQDVPADDPIAIVGTGCRFGGGVTSPEALWQLLVDGADVVSGFPTDRGWDVDGLYDPDPTREGRTYVRHGAFLDDIAGFDAQFFGISPREAIAMDPQQRHLLEVAWETVESAGVDPAALRGSDTGVFVGGNWLDYLSTVEEAGLGEGYRITGNTLSVLSGRIAYFLGLHGPAVTVDTACSSSLVALHQACQAIRAGECARALVAGTGALTSPRTFVEFARQRAHSADGHCKAYADDADGTAWGEGIAAILVEPLSAARAAGHRVLAVVHGSAVNQDGGSAGLAVPNGRAQQRVITQALTNAGLPPDAVDAVEGHGTGTALGDPIEVRALHRTYGQDRPADRPLLLGSVKSNVNHTQAAAGLAGVLKVVLALTNNTLPPTAHVTTPSTRVDWSTVQLLTEARKWTRADRPRIAGVSAFGVSGTNAHVLVGDPSDSRDHPLPELVGHPSNDHDDPPSVSPDSSGHVNPLVLPSTGPTDDQLPHPPTAQPVIPLVLSATGTAALRAHAAQLRDLVAARPTDVARALVTSRAELRDRAVVVGRGAADLVRGLDALAGGRPAAGVVVGSAQRETSQPVFVFPGQGAHWVGMGAQLLDASPVFARCVAECAEALSGLVEWSLVDVLRGVPGAPAVDRPDVMSPASFAMMVSLAALWRSLGVEPAAVVGHSQGEVAAAYVAGVLPLAEAMRVVVKRGEVLARLLGHGAMLAVLAPADRVRDRMAPLGERVSVAAVNAAEAVTVSGDPEAIEQLAAWLTADGVRARRIPGADGAGHSAQVDALRDDLMAALGQVKPCAGDVPFFSTVTAGELDTTTMDTEYWYRNARDTVRFHDTIQALLAADHRAFLEVSAHPLLGEAIQQTAGNSVVGGTLRRGEGGWDQFLGAAAALSTQGVRVEWTAAVPMGAPVDLPTYPFQHTRFWPESTGPDVDRWRYRDEWRPHPRPPAGAATGSWLVFANDDDWSTALLDGLSRLGMRPVRVDPDDRSALAGAAAAGVLCLLGTDEEDGPAVGVPAGMAASVSVVQALGAAGVTAPLWLVTRGGVAVDGEPLEHPAQAQTWGLGRATALEHPERWGGLVDLPDELDETAISRLSGVLATGGDEDQVAVRPHGVFVRRLVPAPPHPTSRRWRPRPDGTVLITGGTGVLAGHVARWLARAGAGHLVLASRRGADAPGMTDRVAELERLGARVTVVSCDVRDRERLRSVLAGIPAEFPLSAVVHTAGIGRLQPLAEITAADLAEVMAAKAGGAAHLHELTRDVDLDAFVLFSAVSATWGVGRQAHYGAANAYLDALARHRRAHGLVATSIAWTGWTGAGMAVEDAALETLRRNGLPADAWDRLGMSKEEAARQVADRWGLRPVAPETQLVVLGKVLDRDETTVTVVDVDWPRFVAGYASARRRPLLDEIPEARAAMSTDDHGDGTAPDLRDVLRDLPRPKQLAHLVDLVREHAAAVLGHVTADAVDADTDFLSLGFDSGSAVLLRNQLNAATGLRLPGAAVFDHPTAAGLGEYIRGQLVDDEDDVPEPATDTLVRLYERACATGATTDGADLLDLAGRLRDRYHRATDLPRPPEPVRLAEGTDQPVLICLPPYIVPAGPHQYARFAAQFEGRHDIWVLPHPGFDAGEPVAATADVLAETHADTALAIASGRPFVLVGYSSGGWAAHGVAARVGAAALGVCMLDSYSIEYRGDPGVTAGMMAQHLRTLEFVSTTGDELSAMGHYQAAFHEWTVPAVTIPSLLVRATTAGPAGPIPPPAHVGQVVPVPGDHYSIMTDDVATTAAAVRAWLDLRSPSHED